MERGHWLDVGALGPEDALVALAEPARQAERPFEPAAAAYLTEQAGGLPYAVQVYGEHAWWASEGAGSVGHLGARAGARLKGRRDLEASLYRARWYEASRREREYLVAVAELSARGERPTGGAIARHLGTTTPALSQYRGRVLAKGTLLAEGEDLALRFTVPGMAGYVFSQGHLSANCRTAVPTRAHQSGGQPTSPAPAHGRALTRSPPPPGAKA